MVKRISRSETRSSQSSSGSQPVTRDDVVQAALELGDTDGLEALSIRRVAGVVGLSPMSVYKFVDSKDALLDAVLLSVIDRMEPPYSIGEDWQERIVEILTTWRRLIEQHPCVVEILALRRIPAGSRGLAVLAEHVLANLERGGVENARAVRTFWQLLSLTFGFVMFERARTGIDGAAQATAAEEMRLTANRHGLSRVADLATDLTTIENRGSLEDAVRVVVSGLT